MSREQDTIKMEPNHWSSLNPQYAARLSAGGVPGNPGSLPFLDQHGFAAAGLGALSSSLSPHSSLTSHISSIPAMSYGHPIPGNAMTQILDSLTGQAYAPGQVPYKTVGVGQPAYALDPAMRSNSETVTSRFSAQNQQAKISLFNTDPHTMKEPSHSPTNSAPTSSEPSKTWGASSYVSLGSFFTVAGEAVMSGNNSHSSPMQEPPPAHTSHIRVSAAQKLSFERKPDYSALNSHTVQPPEAHNNAYTVEQPRSHLLEDMLKPSSQPPIAHSNSQASGHATSPIENARGIMTNPQGYIETRQGVSNAHCVERSQSMSSQSSFSEMSPSLPNQQASYPNSPHLQTQATPSPGNHHQQLAKVSHVPQPPANYSTYNSAIGSYTSSGALNTMNYDPISPPAAVNPEPPSLSLHDFADISSHQTKIPMTSVPTPSMHMSSTLQQQQQQQQPQQQQQQTVNTKPVSTSQTPAHQLPIQAVADSTTKPRRGGRKASGASRNSKAGTTRKKKNQAQDETCGTIQIVETVPHQQEFTVGLVESCLPGTNNYSVVSPSTVVMPQMTTPAITQQTLISQEHVITQDQPTYMTNSYGGTFIDPDKNNSVSRSHINEVQAQSGEGKNPLIDPNHEVVFTPLSPKQKYRTKAEQKQMPVATITESMDDEFAHLTEDAEPNVKVETSRPSFHTVSNQIPGTVTQHNSFASRAGANVQGSLFKQTPTKSGKDFQSSFLSFLQGHKAETLSSVTNSAITVKPELPKYIPDPWPRIIPTTPATDNDKKDVLVSKKTSNDSVTFSDDDSESGKCKENHSEAVDKVICQLDDDSAKPQKISGRGRPAKGRRRSSSTRSSGKRRKNIYKCLPEGDEDENLKEVLPPRRKIARRAKQKAARKRKFKRKKRKFYSDESSETDDDYDYVELSSSSEMDEDNESCDDPIWRPCGQSASGRGRRRRGGSFLDEDDDDLMKFVLQRKCGRPTSHKRRGRPPSNMTTISIPERTLAPNKPLPITEDTMLFLSDDEEIPHLYEKGYFVIDRRDLTKYDSYPIWKIDAGSLLQKFEPFIRKGQMFHKSLCTYSSWSDNIRERYKTIGVRWIHRSKERDQDVVQVLEQYKPKPVDDRLEEEPLMQAFNVYVQIVISQALEPGFLSAIKSEEDEYYSVPTKTIDELLNEKKTALIEKIKWTSNFQASVEKYPYLSTGEESDDSAQSRPMLKAVQLSGKPYVRDTLEECNPTDSPDARTSKEFLVSSRTATLISIYHSLHHFKYMLYKRCCSKVMLLRGTNPADNSELLDQCLQNRAWVHKLYHNLMQLLDKASATVEASSLTSSPSIQGALENAASAGSQSLQPSESSELSKMECSEQQTEQLAVPKQKEEAIQQRTEEATETKPAEENAQLKTVEDAQLGSDFNREQVMEDSTQGDVEYGMQLACEEVVESSSQTGSENLSQVPSEAFTEESMQLTVEEQVPLYPDECSQLDSEESVQQVTQESSVCAVNDDRASTIEDISSATEELQSQDEAAVIEPAAGQ